MDGLTDVAPVKVDPEKYPQFMADLQPPTESAPLVETKHFEVPDRPCSVTNSLRAPYPNIQKQRRYIAAHKQSPSKTYNVVPLLDQDSADDRNPQKLQALRKNPVGIPRSN